MRISATILLAAALAGVPAQSLAGARAPLVIRGFGPEDFSATATDHVRPSRPYRHLSSRWRGERAENAPAPRFAADEPAYEPTHAPDYAPAWRQPTQPIAYGQIALARPLYRIRYAGAENPYDRAYRPGAYSAADPFPPRPTPSGYFLDESPSLYAR